jgi:hypothetical protein
MNVAIIKSEKNVCEGLIYNHWNVTKCITSVWVYMTIRDKIDW